MNLTLKKQNLENEFHDACGIGFIAEINGKPSRRVIDYSFEALKNMSHRGASGADQYTSDGAGILTDLSHNYFSLILKEELRKNISNGTIAVAMVFTSEKEKPFIEELFIYNSRELDIEYLGCRTVPVNKAILGESGKNNCPEIIQYFFCGEESEKFTYETRLYLLRKTVEQKILIKNFETFICSLSSKTIVYKGMMKPHHLSRFYYDLTQPEYKARVSIFHERFSTNTTSSWSMAQPFRMLGHNGEINTIKGNRLWMQTREAALNSKFWKEHIEKLKPIVSLTGSDSYSFDNLLEFLVQSGRSLFHSIMMMIPEPYIFDTEMSDELKNFYIYNENILEPWDGPAALVFTDGEIVGAKLDRNGLRPLRYTRTKDGLVIMASEAGVVDIENENVLMHHHMRYGENFALKLDGGGILSNREIINQVANKKNYSELIQTNLSTLERKSEYEEFGDFALPEGGFDKRLRIAFGIDKEDCEKILFPMAETGNEAIGSMGDDTPIAILSQKERKLYDYFIQKFAQVTSPPIDSIRERYVMSLYRYIGAESDFIDEKKDFHRAIRIDSPILSPREVKLLLEKRDTFPHAIIKCHLEIEKDLESRIDEICDECKNAVLNGIKIIFLSDEGLKGNEIPIPMLLMVSAVHQFLVQEKLRNKCALLCFTGSVIEDHHVASLVSFGASAVYPFMAYELIREFYADKDWQIKLSNYRTSIEKSLLKIMGKMGISTVSSYHGSMLFHAVGISKKMIDKYFPSIKTELEGLTTDSLKKMLISNYVKAFSENAEMEEIGKFKFRNGGEAHGFSPNVFKEIHSLSEIKQHKVTADESLVYIRDLLDYKVSEIVPLEKVEPTSSLLKRMGLGAISYGAISEESHRLLARAASILGIRSNTGEGGEHKDRYSIYNPNSKENCYIKQVASGRFGVTSSYLTSAREIQIKIAQGAKPGEGGHLPGEKVTLSIANNRHATPGVTLISPPPHHDIYSIEDLAQLIFDLKEVNPYAKISVKLVSQFGIGIVASGVAKAGADIILISGNDGGTGASPLGSLKHTGLPWELGLVEVHNVLLENGLRHKIVLRVDGGIKNARDIIIAAILGAEEFDFGTSALVAIGCVMARQCHSNTCPAGIATQDLELRKRFKCKPEHLINFFNKLSEDLRKILSAMGVIHLSEIIGKRELLIINGKRTNFVKQRNIDLKIFFQKQKEQLIFPNKSTDNKFESNVENNGYLNLSDELTSIFTHQRIIIKHKLKNVDRAFGSKTCGLISFFFGDGSFKGYIQFKSEGVGGQSLGAFLVDNVEIRHCGIANDFVGKGMSGGLISIRFHRAIRKSMEGNTIIGNVALYGATGGELFIAGSAGERFAVRNSGAAAVVEGVGNHCCEYMTRGLVIVLGKIGKNFGAGMTGGVAFIYNNQQIKEKINSTYVEVNQVEHFDRDLIFRYVLNHYFHTQSTIAASVIEDWENESEKFIKIKPRTINNTDHKKIYIEQFNHRMKNIFL
jgi:glutamate synthase domain-containing protein 2/glutamate synthase domain-containing protein 1/glutamate synthase domain-containing protein 3